MAFHFDDPVQYGAGDFGDLPHSVATGDFDGDFLTDLAVVCKNGASVSILLGLGDGTFKTATNFNCGQDPHTVAVGD